MSRKPMQAKAEDKARLEIVFDKPQLLGRLFGEFDQNLVAIENRFGVYIAARGNKLQLEGEAEAIARARDDAGRALDRVGRAHESLEPRGIGRRR